MVFGQNPASTVILATLGLTEEAVGRFRDCGVSNGEIYVYTRNGGGNRECWGCENDSCPGCIISNKLPAHPLYLRDEDDEFDCTYATVYFRFPEEFAADLRAIDSGEKFAPSERWTTFLNALGQTESTP